MTGYELTPQAVDDLFEIWSYMPKTVLKLRTE
jgi:hypothetical protein